MSRLLCAAAHGARIERKHYSFKSFWEEARLVWAREPKDCDYDYRIHPNDEHLQYGPVSTALREVAANPSAELTCTDEFGTWALLYSDWCKCRDLASERDVSLFLLILAEALADEGL